MEIKQSRPIPVIIQITDIVGMRIGMVINVIISRIISMIIGKGTSMRICMT